MSAKKPPLRKQSESVSRGAHRIRVPLGFIELRRALIKCINDVVRVRAGIEKTNPKRLPVKGKAVQIKWIPEVALHAPESIGCAIRHFAFFQRMLSVEGAAGDKVRKLDLAGIGGIDSGVFRETEPDVKVSRKGGVSWIQPHDLIQEDTGVDHLLETRVFSRMRFKNSARLDLGFMRSRRWNDLNRRRFEMSPDKSAHSDSGISAVRGVKGEGTEQTGRGAVVVFEREQIFEHRSAHGGRIR